jgi:membrane protease YdiL (CAAX protease family)
MAHGGAWLHAVPSSELWAFTLTLVLVFPIVDKVLYFRLRSALQIYAWNILAEWSLVAVCVWVIRRNALTLADFGERLGNPARILIVGGVLLAMMAALVLAGRMQAHQPSAEQLSKAAAPVRKLLPVTGTERTVYIVMALTAGVCEEFLYRGWLLNLMGAVTGSLWAALLGSSIVFGLAHLYQGRNGVIGASVLGIVFGTVFITSGSLFPGQALHALMDLKNGLALGKISVKPEPAPGA